MQGWVEMSQEGRDAGFQPAMVKSVKGYGSRAGSTRYVRGWKGVALFPQAFAHPLWCAHMGIYLFNEDEAGLLRLPDLASQTYSMKKVNPSF